MLAGQLNTGLAARVQVLDACCVAHATLQRAADALQSEGDGRDLQAALTALHGAAVNRDCAVQLAQVRRVFSHQARLQT